MADLSKEEKSMLNLFKTMDTDNSNALTKQELKAGFAKGGAKLTDDNLEKMFLFLDKDDSGTISYEEFREYVLMKKKKSKVVAKIVPSDTESKPTPKSKKSSTDQGIDTANTVELSKEEKSMLNLFKTMDTDNSNGLTKQELKAGFAKGGAKLTDDNLEKMFLFLDKDDSGTISYEEFREYILMKKKKSKEVGNGKKPNGPTTKVSTKPKEMYTEKKANSASTKEPENVDRYQQKLRNLWSTIDADKSGTLKTELSLDYLEVALN